MRRFAPLLGATLIAATACGVGNTRLAAPQAPASYQAERAQRLAPIGPFTRIHRSRVKTHDEDIMSGLATFADTRSRLAREAVARGARLTFRTATRSRGSVPMPEGGDTVPVTGQLVAQNLAGNQAGVANATVEIKGKGGQTVATTTTGPDGAWQVALDTKYQRIALTVHYVLANKLWKIGDYDWKGPEFTAGTGVDVGQSVMDPKEANGQAALIQEVFNRYVTFFTASGVNLEFWDSAIEVSWPSGGDYYSWGTVNLTAAQQWDVNAHEIGHAISDIGINMRFGGGQHYIDKCYDETLAWSEGVATFLGLAVSTTPDDPDAKFQFMVKRRAPLRYENVPGDKDPDHPDAPPVCAGPTNEWRAGAAMWDLYDTHADGTDGTGVAFGTIWGAIAKGNGKPAISSVKHAFKYVREKVDPETAAKFPATAKQNTIDL
ncbi:MAG: hypothetical protein FJZ01_23345 [Candidatus Sericytochromatia bacterium]|nr:hypothetical protein [Candidatus Tanganyikabacteria bacterium]